MTHRNEQTQLKEAMNHQKYLEQDYQRKLASDDQYERALLEASTEDEWHPALIAEWRVMFDREYEMNPNELPMSFESWLQTQSGWDVATTVSEWHFKQ